MEEMQTPEPMSDPLVTWQAPSTDHHIRSQRWYVIAGVAVLAMAVYGIVTGAWTFTVVILLCAAMYVLLRGHTPPLRTIALWERGFRYEHTFIRWEDVEGFWFTHAHDFTELHFAKKASDEEIMIHVRDVDLQQLHTLLSHFTPELTNKHDKLLDVIIRLCKL